MRDAETLTMSAKELDRWEIIGRVVERRLTQRAAAARLGLSLRPVGPMKPGSTTLDGPTAISNPNTNQDQSEVVGESRVSQPDEAKTELSSYQRWARSRERDERGHFISDSDPSPDAKPPPQTIIDLIDRYYPEFNDPSWTNWRVFLKALFHLDMSEAECDTFKRFTKRDTLPSKSFEEAWLVVGRRGGKSRIMSLIAVYLTMCRTYKLARGETGLFMILAKDKRQARVGAP